jgi:protein involved in polysaccharide export with SLBB domain
MPKTLLSLLVSVVLALPATAAGQAELQDVTYGVRPGDEVEIRIFSSAGAQIQEVSGVRIVDPNGQLYLPYIGPINVQGMSATEIRERLAQEYSRLYDDPVVEAVSRVNVNVTGAVRSPGHYLLHPSSTLIDALAEAGGISPDIDVGYQGASDPERARLVRGGELHVLDLRPETPNPVVFNVPVQSGDWIHIPIQEQSKVREQVQFWGGVLSVAVSAVTLAVLISG